LRLATFFAAGFAAAFLRRFGAAFLAAGFAAAFLRRFGAAFFAAAGFAAAFLRRFGAAFFAAGAATAAFLRRFGAAFFAAAGFAAAFLRFGAAFLAAAMCLSPKWKGSDPSPKPVSWISVTDNKKNCHYIVQKNTVRVVNYFFIFFMHLIKSALFFMENNHSFSRFFRFSRS
jgi:uncharacterized protein YjeT (DUF2065 family)